MSKGKKAGKIIFTNCGSKFVEEWLGKYENETKAGQTCKFHFNNDFSKFDTGKDKSHPLWQYYDMTHSGEWVYYQHNGIEHRPYLVRWRNYGTNKKVVCAWRYEKRVDDVWIPYL